MNAPTTLLPRLSRIAALALAAGLVAGLPTAAHAQAAGQLGGASAAAPVSKRDTLIKLMRPITINFQDQRLEDVLRFLEEYSGVDLEPRWADERTLDGLDKEALVTMRAENLPILTVLERVLAQVEGDLGSGNTWQFTEWGAIEVGPKEVLNKRRRIEIYDINDLLLETPDYHDVPEIDLQQVVQSSGGRGGGGGRSPFRDEQDQRSPEEEEQRRQERVDETMELLQSLVEPEQWMENGGSGGSMRYYQGTLIVNAPDYMHRQLNGYPFWPASGTSVTMVAGRRYVSLNMDSGISTVDGIAQHPVTAIVGGRPVRSDDPPGGGGSATPPPSGPR